MPVRKFNIVFVKATFLASLFLVTVGIQPSFAVAEPGRLVSVEEGDLPIILSAPHGGRELIPGVPKRLGEGVARFKSVTDSNTDKLTEQLADALEKKLGKRPYVVIARFGRKYADANRIRRLAYESENAKPVYDEYHDALENARREVIKRWGYGILLDLHGQAAEPKTIIRGTQNGTTTKHLVSRFGLESLSGQSSLFGQLAKQGFSINPPLKSTAREHENYDGGYIVQNYGSSSGQTLDAIQLELGIDLRSVEVIPVTAEKLAKAIAAFSNKYLPKTEWDELVNEQLKQTVSVGVYSDKGAGASLKSLIATLATFKAVEITQLSADDIRKGALTDIDVLIQPGGSGGTQGRHLGEEGREKIREYISDGGGLIGICAGAYLASADYEWSLDVLDAKVIDRKHWARGKGMVDISLTEVGQQVLKTEDEQLHILYAQGPLLAPAENDDIADYEPIAIFKTEIAKNGAPKGVMKGTTAIAQGRYGSGRVLCFSPHPELTEGLEELVQFAIESVKRNRR